MSVSRDEVLRIAQLAELEVEEDGLTELVEHMSQILEYVAQLQGVTAGDGARPFTSGPDAVRLRPDEVKPLPLAVAPGDMAPKFKSGFFVVPRLGQFEEGE